MYSVKGIYNGNNVVLKEPISAEKNCEVTVVFSGGDYMVRPSFEERKRAWDNLQKLIKNNNCPADFDYKKELAEYRDERYGR